MMQVELEFDYTRLELKNSYPISTDSKTCELEIFKLELDLELVSRWHVRGLAAWTRGGVLRGGVVEAGVDAWCERACDVA